MNWKTVESSNLDALAYEGGLFFVRFKNGGVYQYSNVDPDTVHAIESAESIGRAFFQLVKAQPDRYPFQRLN